MEALKSLFTLGWRQQTPKQRPLPAHVERKFVSSPLGDLELLISRPKQHRPTDPAIFFAHGGYGSAGVWLEWMSYLHESGYGGNLYAYSARNHGGSYSVSYLRMVYGTHLDDIVSDFATCFHFAQDQETSTNGNGAELVLVGHSSGGGVSQYALNHNMVRCRALCLVGAIPHFGAL
jgi:pimeloyl-ACP methyl ester carboxylesterase